MILGPLANEILMIKSDKLLNTAQEGRLPTHLKLVVSVPVGLLRATTMCAENGFSCEQGLKAVS